MTAIACLEALTYKPVQRAAGLYYRTGGLHYRLAGSLEKRVASFAKDLLVQKDFFAGATKYFWPLKMVYNYVKAHPELLTRIQTSAFRELCLQAGVDARVPSTKKTSEAVSVAALFVPDPLRSEEFYLGLVSFFNGAETEDQVSECLLLLREFLLHHNVEAFLAIIPFVEQLGAYNYHSRLEIFARLTLSLGKSFTADELSLALPFIKNCSDFGSDRNSSPLEEIMAFLEAIQQFRTDQRAALLEAAAPYAAFAYAGNARPSPYEILQLVARLPLTNERDPRVFNFFRGIHCGYFNGVLVLLDHFHRVDRMEVLALLLDHQQAGLGADKMINLVDPIHLCSREERMQALKDLIAEQKTVEEHSWPIESILNKLPAGSSTDTVVSFLRKQQWMCDVDTVFQLMDLFPPASRVSVLKILSERSLHGEHMNLGNQDILCATYGLEPEASVTIEASILPIIFHRNPALRPQVYEYLTQQFAASQGWDRQSLFNAVSLFGYGELLSAADPLLKIIDSEF